jgi:fibronectin type 3 domain-containing protein
MPEVAAYDIYRASSISGPYSKVASNVADSFYDDSSVVLNAANFYHVSPIGPRGQQYRSSTSTYEGRLANILPPDGLVATTLTNGIEISWDNATDAVSYRLYRGISAFDTLELIADQSETTFQDLVSDGLLPGMLYTYTVASVNSSGDESQFSSYYAGTSDPNSGKHIGSILTLTSSETSSSVTLNWSAATNADQYKVFRREVGGNGLTYHMVHISPTAALTATDDSVDSGVTYIYQVKGMLDNGHEAGFSSQIEVVVP